MVPEKGGGGTPTGHKFETLKHFSALRTLQNGVNQHVEGPSKKRRLSSKDGPEGCIPDGIHLEGTPKIPSISIEGLPFRVSCLPFGLASAPRVFTKLMKPVLSILRQRGICLIAYLDDFLIMGETRQLALQHAATTLNLPEVTSLPPTSKNSVLKKQKSYKTLVTLDPRALQEVHWWRDNLVA